MTQKLKSRKGATLAELMIVLAVLVIASGMVVSFSSMMHGAQSLSNARQEALRDVTTAESLIEGFIENNVGDDYRVEFDDNGILTFTNKNDYTKKSQFRFVGNNVVKILQMNNYDSSPVQIQVDHIQSIDFTLLYKNGENIVEMKKDNRTYPIDTSNDILYYCTITYEVADTSYTYTFCVNPYAGEEVS